MNNRIIITKMPLPGHKTEAIVSGILEEGRLAEVSVSPIEQKSILQNIYIGKVQNIVKNINAAFIEFQKGQVGYYPLEELPNAIFTKKQGKKPLVIGDELLVQVAKEPLKTKAAVLTTNLNFPGTYVVITTGRKGIGISGKITSERKKELKELVEARCTGTYGVVIRTNAADAPQHVILQELNALEQQAEKTVEEAKYRTVFSKIKEEAAEHIRFLKNAYLNQIDEIITDDEICYQELLNYLEVCRPQEAAKLRLYQDALLPLYKLYNLPMQLEAALKSHIWLKSGAYLLIEPTEAFTVIDVNTGKFDGRKNKQDTFLKINLEAAREITRQLRLRNLSGIILIDFINMEDSEAVDTLLEEFRNMVKKDRIQTNVVDITALGIVEVTRKKERCSLMETKKKLNAAL